MVKKTKPSAINLDWYLISIEKVKKIAWIVGIIIILLGVGYYLFSYYNAPKTKAYRAIKQAQKTADQIPQRANFSEFRISYAKIQEKIQEAQKLFLQKDYKKALISAQKATELAKSILSEQKTRAQKPDARIIRLEGKVEIQRGEEGIWEAARPMDDLFAGDYIKTGHNGGVEILVENNVVKLGSDTLYEVTPKGGGTAGKGPKLRMVAGEINIFTKETEVQVETPALKAKIAEESHVAITADKEGKKGSITALMGAAEAQIRGEKVQVKQYEQAVLTPEGGVAKHTILPAPQLSSPPDGKVYVLGMDSSWTLEWTSVPGAKAYRVEIDLTSFFINPLIQSTTSNTYRKVTTKGRGTFYWRVIAIDNNGRLGQPSPHKSFRVILPSEQVGIKLDRVPPELHLNEPTIFGNICNISGSTEPGASVEINGTPVEVKADGTFIHIINFDKVGYNQIVVRAVDPSGNETVKKKQVLIEEY